MAPIHRLFAQSACSTAAPGLNLLTFSLLLQRQHAAQPPRHANSSSSPPSNPCRNNRLRVISVKHNGRSLGSGISGTLPTSLSLSLSCPDGDTHTGGLETHLRRHLPAPLTLRVDRRAEGKSRAELSDSVDLFSSSTSCMPRCSSIRKRWRQSDLPREGES